MRSVFFILSIAWITTFRLAGQNTMYRAFSQTPPINSAYYFSNCEFQEPQKTLDKGYIFSYFPWAPNLHNLYPADFYTIKTDSNFIPQWKKPFYSKAVVLPSGGVMLIYNTFILNGLYNGMHIEKITQSGIQSLIKQYTAENIVLNDGVYYDGKIRFVGRKRGSSGYPYYYETSQAYTLLIDTSGNFISQSDFTTSGVGDVDFSRIKRNAQGDFFVYSVSDPVSASTMSIAKFDSTFTFVWAKELGGQSFQALRISDIDFLPGGNIFASAANPGNNGAAVLLKLSSVGNIISQKTINNRYRLTSLCKKTNGNYIASVCKFINTEDSLFLFETDTLMNILWFKFVGKGVRAGPSIIKNNSLYTTTFANINPYLFENDLNGNSCTSISVPFSTSNTTIQLSGFTLTAASSTASIGTSTLNLIALQSYSDQCMCAPFISNGNHSACLPANTATVNITGTGNLSWYSTPVGNSFLASGNQYVYSSLSPTICTIYAQDSACTLSPGRTPVTISIHSTPVLTVSPQSPSVCIGYNVFIFASGATNYTWTSSSNPNFFANGYVINANPLVSTVYTVTGSVAPNCADTKTLSLTVMPFPTVTVGPPVHTCFGIPAVIAATGAINYSWGGGINTSTLLVPGTSPMALYTVIGNNGVCSASAIQTVIAHAPIITISGSPSTSLCIGSSLVLSASGVNTYTWSNFANTYSTAVSPTISTIFSVLGTDFYGCPASNSQSVTVFQDPTVSIAFSGSASTPVCAGSQQTLTLSGANIYTNNGYQVPGSFTVAPITNTIYTITGTDLNSCYNTATIAINVVASPTLNIVLSNSVICSGAVITMSATGANSYTWNNTFSGNSFSVIPNISSTYTAQGINLNNCISTAIASVMVLLSPTLNLNLSSQTICSGATVTMTISGATTYSWSNFTSSSVNVVSPGLTTTYSVVGSNNNSCIKTMSGTVMVFPSPTITINSSASVVCSGSPVSFTANGATSYTWLNGSNSNIINFNPVATGNYFVNGTSGNNCTSNSNVYVAVNPLPIISVLSSAPRVCIGSSLTVKAIGASTYLWSTGANTSSTSLSPTVATTYSVYGTDLNNCTGTAAVTISVVPLPIITISSNKGIICAGESFTLVASGASIYSWNTISGIPTLIDSLWNTGIFYVSGTDYNNCTNTASYTQIVDICTSLFTEQNEKNLFSFFPNPNNGNFTIVVPSLPLGLSIQLFNSLGQLILAQELSAKETPVDIQDFAPGIYSIKFLDKDLTYSFKIVKQ